MLRTDFDNLFFFVKDQGKLVRGDRFDQVWELDGVTVSSEEGGDCRMVGTNDDRLTVREELGSIYFNDGDEDLLREVAKKFGL